MLDIQRFSTIVLICALVKGKSECPSGQKLQPGQLLHEQYRCRHLSTFWRQCVPSKSVCDGKNDCVDRSDEENCTPFYGCMFWKFQCADKRRCISKRKKCDGNDDCLDRSDEVNCPCSGFKCVSGSRTCLPTSKRCDGRTHCSDGSDEKDCVCATDRFQCGTTSQGTKCLQRSLVCNGYTNCDDGSDEQDCERKYGTLIKVPTIVAIVSAMLFMTVVVTICRHRLRDAAERRNQMRHSGSSLAVSQPRPIASTHLRLSSLINPSSTGDRSSTGRRSSTDNQLSTETINWLSREGFSTEGFSTDVPTVVALTASNGELNASSGNQPPSYSEAAHKPDDEECPPYTESQNYTESRILDGLDSGMVEIVERDGTVAFVSIPEEPPPPYDAQRSM